MRVGWMGVAAVVASCGGGGSDAVAVAPTPLPPPPSTVTGTLTDTVTGAVIEPFTYTGPLPARVLLSARGYVTRSVRLTASRRTVDLFPEAGFDLGFYRQFARDALDEPGDLRPLAVLTQAPSFYLQTASLQPATVAALEAVVRLAVPALTGGRFTVASWTTGAAQGDRRVGHIAIDAARDDRKSYCGLASTGALIGTIDLNLIPACAGGGHPIDPGVLLHEVGHALGFYHTDRAESVMSIRWPWVRRSLAIPAIDRHHAALAYARPRGNTDVDVDP